MWRSLVAVTFGFAVQSGNYAKLAPYIVSQMAVAFLGAVLVRLHFLQHWKETENRDFKLLCFCTMPAIRNFAANLISEIIGTLVLVLCWARSSPKRLLGLAW